MNQGVTAPEAIGTTSVTRVCLTLPYHSWLFSTKTITFR